MNDPLGSGQPADAAVLDHIGHVVVARPLRFTRIAGPHLRPVPIACVTMRHIPVPDDGLQRLSKKKASATWLGAGDGFAVALVFEVSVLAADARQSRPLAQECTGDGWQSGWSRSTRRG